MMGPPDLGNDPHFAVLITAATRPLVRRYVVPAVGCGPGPRSHSLVGYRAKVLLGSNKPSPAVATLDL